MASMSWTTVERKKASKRLGYPIRLTCGDWDQMGDLEHDIYMMLDDPQIVISMTRFAIRDRLKESQPETYPALTAMCISDTLYDDTISKYVVGKGEKPKKWRLKRDGDLIYSPRALFSPTTLMRPSSLRP